ncbi:hypothetical protein O6H91_03G051800 [Diphasiastrum complanatum]|nr:hypothetical protein O6H91_03G051800 [Diphasiastrum complanatum]
MTSHVVVEATCTRNETHFTLLIPGLPDDLSLLCLARVPRRYHNLLRTVCKRWKECGSSELFYSLRKILGVVEGWVYVLSRDKSECLRWHVLDPLAKRWMQLPNMPDGCLRRYGMACEVLDMQLFVMGGCGKYENPTNEVLRYDPLRNIWREAPCMETPRCYFGSGVFNGQIYAIGGMGSTSGALTSWEVYDKKSKQWSSYDDPNIVSDLGESLVLDGRIYVRHACPSFIPPSCAWVHNPEQNTWDTIDNEMMQRWCGPATAVGDDIYMLDQTLGIKLMLLDKETNSWNSVGRLSTHSIRPTCRIAAVGNSLYVVGRGLKALVLNLEKVQNHRGLLVTSSINGLECSDEIIVSCNIIEL